jgi:hypothetical protein
MTPQETVILARYVKALCPQQAFDSHTPDAWHDVLGAYRLDDARQAAANLAARQPFISPGEIVPEIRRIRDSRIGSDQPAYEPPPEGETGAQYIARRRQQLAAIGDGREKPIPVGALTGGPAPEVAERLRHMLARVGEMPDHIRQQITADTGGVYGAAKARFPELVVDCPRADCRAHRGRPCHTPRGREMRNHTHDQRQQAYAAALAAQEASA